MEHMNCVEIINVLEIIEIQQNPLVEKNRILTGKQEAACGIFRLTNPLVGADRTQECFTLFETF